MLTHVGIDAHTYANEVDKISGEFQSAIALSGQSQLQRGVCGHFKLADAIRADSTPDATAARITGDLRPLLIRAAVHLVCE